MLGLIGWNCPGFRDSGIRKRVWQYIQYAMDASYRLQTPRKAWMWGDIRMKDTDIDAESGIGCLVEMPRDVVGRSQIPHNPSKPIVEQ